MRLIAVIFGCAALGAVLSGCSRGSYDCAGGQPDGTGGCTKDTFLIGMGPTPPLPFKRCMAALLPAYRKAVQPRALAAATCRARNADWYTLNLIYQGKHAAHVTCTTTGVDKHGHQVLPTWPLPLTVTGNGTSPGTAVFMRPGQTIHLTYHLSGNAPGPVFNYGPTCHGSPT
jgi:hypothetical protein